MENFIRNKTKPYSEDLLFVASGDHERRATSCDEEQSIRNASTVSSTSSSGASRPLLDPNFESVFRPTQMRCLALVSHNEMKAAMKTFVIANKNILKKFRLTGTNSTMSMLREVFAGDESMLVFGPSCRSGPLGGDAELVALMCADELGGMIFFQDPMSAHPHQPDIDCLCRQAIVHNIMMVGNPTSALMMMTTLRVALKENKPELIPSFFCTLQSPSVGAYKKQQQEVILSHSQHRREFDEQDGMLELPAGGAIQQSSYDDPQALLAFESTSIPALVSIPSACEVPGSKSTVSSRRRKGTSDNKVSPRKNALSPSHPVGDANDKDTADTVASFSSIASRHPLVDAEEKLAISIANFVEAVKNMKMSESGAVTQHAPPHFKSGAELLSKSHHSYFLRNGFQNQCQQEKASNESYDKLSPRRTRSKSADIMNSSRNSIRKIATSADAGTISDASDDATSLPQTLFFELMSALPRSIINHSSRELQEQDPKKCFRACSLTRRTDVCSVYKKTSRKALLAGMWVMNMLIPCKIPTSNASFYSSPPACGREEQF